MPISVGDIVIVEREDRHGARIPMHYRRYVDSRNYYYRARVVELCPEKRYYRVQPLPSIASENVPYFLRKATKSKTVLLG